MTTAGGANSERPGGGGAGGGDITDAKPVGGGHSQTDPSWSLNPAHNYNQQQVNSTGKSYRNNKEDSVTTTTTSHNNYSQTTKMIIKQHPDKLNDHYGHQDEYDDNNYEDEDDELELSEALLAVASAEEYAAKIIKLQQACLTPLKEDLADWLNKILNTSNITTENFMDKLDNGVIICRLAKIISVWCEQQLASEETNNVHSTTTPAIAPNANNNDKIITDTENYFELPSARRSTPFGNSNGPLRSTTSQSTNCIVSAAASTNSLNYTTTTTNSGSYLYHSNQFLNNLIRMIQTKIWEEAKGRTFYARDNVCNFIKWSKEFGVNQSVLFESDDLVLHANARQVVLCLLDVARIAYVKYGFTEAPGLVKFEQEIDRELAAQSEGHVHSSTGAIYALSAHRSSDNKPNNSDDTERKASSRARSSRGLSIGDATDELIMRYCKHKEEEALRKRLEQEELEEKEKLAAAAARLSSGGVVMSSSSVAAVDSPDCLQANLNNSDSGENPTITSTTMDDLPDLSGAVRDETAIGEPSSANPNKASLIEMGRVDSLDSGEGPTESASTGHSGGGGGGPLGQNNLTTDASHDAMPLLAPIPSKRTTATSSSSFSPSLTSHQTESTTSMTNSEVSSSRSSLLSNQDTTSSNNHSASYGRHITSDLDGKVMRIAKSYYGKGATKDVTRLSEGKYKIADRIVFVRLLKGHRVMVRIGGGWDTLENFLFRHKSDPSQVIDVDNLLPIETKMSFEKSSSQQMSSSSISNNNTPTHNGGAASSLMPNTANSRSSSRSRLPYYRRSNSASSTNLSMSNLSTSNHSITSSMNSPLAALAGNHHHHNNNVRPAAISSSQQLNNINNISSSVDSSPAHSMAGRRHQIPYLLIHKGHHQYGPASNNMKLPNAAFYNHNNDNNKPQQHPDNNIIPQPADGAIPTSLLRRPLYYQHQQPNQKATPNNRFNYHHQQQQQQRPLATSRAPTTSATNLYPATLTTRITPNSIKSMASNRLLLNSTNNLYHGTATTKQAATTLSKQEEFKRYGRSSESLQASPAHNRLPSSQPFRAHNGKLNGSHLQSNNGNKSTINGTKQTTTTTRTPTKIVSNKNLKQLNDTNGDDNGLVEEKESETNNRDIILL